jgi:3-phenylpropionate/trans-cinnamate dioxygenase ferredoxin reductase subunit
MRDPIVIIGSGMAGGNAAATLRDEGFSGPVVLLSREPGVPFGRPPLSKTYLRSEEDLTGWYVRPAGWYAEHDVELRNGVVVAAVDPAAHTVTLDSGAEIRYEKVLIATGGRNRRIKADGAGLPGIHYLRTVAQCDAIKQEAVRGRTAVIVGMGFIGCEVAASLTQLGVRVTAVFPGRDPLERVLGDQVAGVMSAIHRANGVELLAGEQVAAFEGTSRVEAAVTRSGRRIECDFAVAGVGIEPDIPAVGVEQQNGILPTSTRLVTWRTSCTRCSAGSGSSTTTTRRSRAPPLPGRCSVRRLPTTTSTASGQISTTTNSSTSAMSTNGTSSWSAAACRRRSWSASTSSTE